MTREKRDRKIEREKREREGKREERQREKGERKIFTFSPLPDCRQI